MKQKIIIHYAEIGLKGRNRFFFENRLIKNIRNKFNQDQIQEIKNLYGRIILTVFDADPEDVKTILGKIPGIKYFAFTEIASWDIKEMQTQSCQLIRNLDFKTFRVSAKRASKDFPLTSREINEKIGAYILKNLPGKKVDLDNPQAVVFLELINRQAFIYYEKIQGVGGLPVGASGKVLSLISAGIDSPVASFRMMKRGAEVLFLHFHSYPQTSRESINNVRDIVKILAAYQIKSKLYLAPFLDYQKEVVEKGNVKDRVILYRRMMLRVAEEVAVNERINTLVTGESLGQVASQTLTNMHVIAHICTKTQVFKPLICYDKEEIIKEAESIGTYEASSRGYEDCCSLFVPTSPNTKADLQAIEQQEQSIDIRGQLNKIMQSLEIKNINN